MYGDLTRPPLSEAGLVRALVYDGSLWSSVRVVSRTGSTNADLLAAGAGAGAVLVAEYQVTGRGRLDRTWTSPPQAGLTFSVLLQPAVPPARRGWLPLLGGVALVDALRDTAEVDAALKWPNDVRLGRPRRKAAGILATAAYDDVVVGVGLNVTNSADELPPDATSLALAGAAVTDRQTLLPAVLRAVETRYRAWTAVDGDAAACGLLSAYAEVCDTLGRGVTVALPSGAELRGTAEAVDSAGRLLVRANGELHALAAGDVRHVRST